MFNPDDDDGDGVYLDDALIMMILNILMNMVITMEGKRLRWR